MVSSPWDLDPCFGKVLEPEISVVLTTVVYQPGKHLCQTLVNRQQFFTDCILQRGYETHTILDGCVQNCDGKWWIRMGPNTRSFSRPVAEMEGLYHIVDACSGLGAVAKGYEACGARVLCHVESNEVFHQWSAARTTKPCIRGNVADMHTVFEVSKCVQQSHVLAAGVSCQPFSGLGDGKQGQDTRSASFTGILMMVFFSVAFLSCWNVQRKP